MIFNNYTLFRLEYIILFNFHFLQKDFNYCPKLQRLYLSYNNIKSLSCLKTLETISNLQELSLDNNPVCALEVTTYKRDLLALLPSLRKLDTRRISEEEKRVAEKAWTREIVKRREIDEMALLEERKRLAIRDAENEWIHQIANDEKIKIGSFGGSSASYQPSDVVISSASSSSIASRSSNNEAQHLDDFSGNEVAQMPSKTSTNYVNSTRSNSFFNKQSYISQTADLARWPLASSKKSISLNGGANILEDNIMSFFGSKSLDILETKIDPLIANQVQIVSFNYIDYGDILSKFFQKIKMKFQNITVSR